MDDLGNGAIAGGGRAGSGVYRSLPTSTTAAADIYLIYRWGLAEMELKIELLHTATSRSV